MDKNLVKEMVSAMLNTISDSPYRRNKFEFKQDLPRVCTGLPDNITRLTYDRGQFSSHSPVRGLTMTTPMARSDFLQYPPNPRPI